jgi:hypothetical protein
MLNKFFIVIMAFSTMASTHFILTIPTSLGFDDDNEVVTPCGGFNATNRDVVTNWHIKGDVIAVLTTHEAVTWEYKAALISDLDRWIHLTPTLNQTGVGDFCEPTIPGLGGRWLNKPVVLQVIQHGPDGILYQVRSRSRKLSLDQRVSF